MTEQRSETIRNAETVVVKVGSRVLTRDDGRLDVQRVEVLADGLRAIADTGRQTILVSSGAVAAGVGKLGLTARPQSVSKLQAVAAVGQAHLIQAYERALAPSGRHAAQVLLTAGDLRRRAAYLNVRNTLTQIHDLGSIAVVNENDSVAVSELRTTFGDNDRLAANVAGLFPTALLVILSDVDGLFDGPPEDARSQLVSTVPRVDDSILALAIERETGLSKGGMLSKLRAARLASHHGQSTIIAAGRRDDVLQQILSGADIGTLFLPLDKGQRGRRRWIGSTAGVEGELIIDEGAARAIRDTGASLLAIGLRQVRGNFSRGAVVSIQTMDGSEIAKGLANYRSEDLRSIRGINNQEIPAILGACPYDSVVHRNNMALQDLKQ